jgi:tetratricopeptide (TPR) repeat protein
MTDVPTLIQEARHWAEQERYRRAIDAYEAAVSLLKDVINDQELLGDCCLELGSLWRLQGSNRNTGYYYQQALEAYTRAFSSSTHEKLAKINFLLGSFLEQIWKLEPAVEYLNKAQTILKASVGEHHAHTEAVSRVLKRVREKKTSHAE